MTVLHGGDMKRRALLAVAALACGVHVGGAADRAPVQTSFRVRSDFTAALDSDQGWAGAADADVTVPADRPIRVRFEVERPPASRGREAFRLQYRRNGGAWTDVEAQDFPYPQGDQAKTPRVSVVSCPAFRNGAPTTDLLKGSAAPFRAGAGVSLAPRTPPWSGPGAQGEFEWAVVVRRFADGAVTNDEGDAFELRMVEADGTPAGAARHPRLTLAVPPRHVGGTFVETPGRIGPWRASNGDLYFVMEPTETDNVFLMIKSADEGRTWREVDGANRPQTADLESVDARLVGDTIHIVHQVTRAVRYHSFRTSDHPGQPDSWAVRDELAATTNSVAQAATLAVRSDGSLVAFYVGPTVEYSVRSPAGQWSPKRTVDADGRAKLAGPVAVLGANDVVHVAYYRTDGTLWYRRLLPGGTLTDPQEIASGAGTTRAEYNAVLPLVFVPQTNTLVIVYRLADGKLWERRVVGDGPPTPAVRVTDRDVVRDAVDSQQPGADVVLDGTTLRVLLIEAASRALLSTHDRNGWQPPALEVENIRGSWVRGAVYTRRDGVRVYGYVYDAGSQGGAGMNRYGELVLAPAGEPSPAR